MPRAFPYSSVKSTSTHTLSNELRYRIDYPGFTLLIAASAFLIVALEESGIQYAWSDPIPIAFLVLSGLLWIAFFVWENIASREGRAVEPVFAWRFVRNRVFWEFCYTCPQRIGFSISNVASECLHFRRADFLAGAPFFVTRIQIPQRFQIVNGTSTLEAGVRMLPFILAIPISTAFASISTSKLRMPPIYLFALGCIFQSVGTGLMSTLPVNMGPKDYGYEVILGLGLGLNIGSVIIVTPNLIRGKDQCLYIHPTLVFSHFSRSSGTSRS